MPCFEHYLSDSVVLYPDSSTIILFYRPEPLLGPPAQLLWWECGLYDYCEIIHMQMSWRVCRCLSKQHWDSGRNLSAYAETFNIPNISSTHVIQLYSWTTSVASGLGLVVLAGHETRDNNKSLIMTDSYH